MKFNKKQKIGSETAKGGFKNEEHIAEKFQNYKVDNEAKIWLDVMGYNFKQVKSLEAKTIAVRLGKSKAIKEYKIPEDVFDFTQKFKKADIQIQLTINIDGILYRENISAKKANDNSNFNQIDKRPVKTYQEMWGFDDDIAQTLMQFTGEIKPNANERIGLKDKRRWYLDEIPKHRVLHLIDFIEKNRTLIFSDIIKGRGMLAAEWFLVTKKNEDNSLDWVLKNINETVNFFSQGNVEISKRGGLKLGKLSAQRKGGTPDPESLQFKVKPIDLFEIK